mgnify:CR=1 FL=1
MAGTDPTFDADEFRQSIHAVMNLGAPPQTGDQVVFYFARSLVYNTPVDDENTPFDPAATVTEGPGQSVTVPCAIEYTDREGEPVPFGMVTATKLAVTLLDEDYDQVKGCAYVVAGGDKYLFRRTVPPVGLYSVGVYTMIFVAENEV